MATSSFFRNYDNFNEQNLIDDLVIESIRIYGVDIRYLPRTLVAVDDVLNEDDLSLFNRVRDFEVYVKSVDGFEGEGDFLSKFGLQIRDQVTFSVARRTFERFVSREDVEIQRPREGDCIFFPLNNKIFKIMHVEHESVFYQTGALQVYDLKCELMEYSGERFQTGYYEIDTAFDNVDPTTSTTLEGLANSDPIAKNYQYEQIGDNIIDFSEIDPFSESISIPDDEPSGNT